MNWLLHHVGEFAQVSFPAVVLLATLFLPSTLVRVWKALDEDIGSLMGCLAVSGAWVVSVALSHGEIHRATQGTPNDSAVLGYSTLLFLGIAVSAFISARRFFPSSE